MNHIRLAILAICLGTLGSMASFPQAYNTADGTGALQSNTSGTYNSAFGVYSLYSNTSGRANTASGGFSLYSNTQGFANTASGYDSLLFNTIGDDNTAFGVSTLQNNINGVYNTALGLGALQSTSTGSYNIGIGTYAGYNNPVGASFNIDIGSEGSANDNNPTIRIGTPGTQTSFFAAGVRGTKTGASDAVEVMIDSNGQLGTVNSSIRFKEDVHDMAAASDGLMRLRPVTYRYKQPYDDGTKPVDYGLIAEEVAEIYPDLVVKNADGQIQTVQYQKLTPMLLNEVQKQHKQLEEQAATVQQQQGTIQQLEKRLAALEAAQPSVASETRPETK